MTDPCTADRLLGGLCRRGAKYTFVGTDRREARCGWHAYDWLGGTMPEWVEHVLIRDKPTAWHRATA